MIIIKNSNYTNIETTVIRRPPSAFVFIDLRTTQYTVSPTVYDDQLTTNVSVLIHCSPASVKHLMFTFFSVT